MPATSAQCIFGTENHPEAGILINYHYDDCSHVYGLMKEDFRALREDEILQL